MVRPILYLSTLTRTNLMFMKWPGIRVGHSRPLWSPARAPECVVLRRPQIAAMAVRLDDAIEAKANRVKELELEADEVHKIAQQLNKLGRHAEAKEAYARMHNLEDQATQLAKEVGCVECVLGDPSCKVSAQQAEEYFELLPVAPWTSEPGADVEHMDQIATRTEGAVIGSLVADAAAMGVHWIYDMTLLEHLTDERRAQGNKQGHSSAQAGVDSPDGMGSGHAAPAQEQGAAGLAAGLASAALTQAGQQEDARDEEDVGLEFVDPPRSPFYAYQSGRNSPYGEQTLVLLRSLAQRQGLDCLHYANAFATYFGEGFDGYRDVSTKGFLRNHSRGLAPPATGAPDAQANCIARAAPLVAGWAGNLAALERAVRCATSVTQNTDAAVAWAQAAASILERVVRGMAPSEATLEVMQHLEMQQEEEPVQAGTSRAGPDVLNGDVGTSLQGEIADQLRRALARAHMPVRQAVAELGRNCHMPNALTTPLHAALHMEYLARQDLHALGLAGLSGPQLVSAQGLATGRDKISTGGRSEQQGEPGVNQCTGNTQGMSEQQGFGTLGHLPWNDQLSAAVGKRFVQGVRAAIGEGGCCASRASYTGAVLGALAGRQGIPDSWQRRYSAHEDVAQATATIVRARGLAAIA